MFPFSEVCSPEMSVSDGIEASSRPHAWVHFDADDEKSFVPLNFILRHPTDWRNPNAWDNSYLYKVFWSGDENDSPCEMLKRVVQIPVYETGTSLEKPGYYRASVLAVDETLEAVQKKVDGKRLSVGLLKYKHTSFDGSTNAKAKIEKDVLPNKKHGDKKIAKLPKGKGGLDHKAHVKNLSFDSTMSVKYPFLKGTESSASKTESSSSQCKTEPSSTQIKTEPSSTQRRSKRNRGGCKKNMRDLCSDSDTELPDPNNDSKKIKLDPSYTPRKTTELEEKLEAAERNLENSYKRNLKLESAKRELEVQLDQKISELNEVRVSLQQKIDELKKIISTQSDELTELQEQVEFLRKKNQGNTNSTGKLDTILSNFEVHVDNIPEMFDESFETDSQVAQFCETSLGAKEVKGEVIAATEPLENVVNPKKEIASNLVAKVARDEVKIETNISEGEQVAQGYELCSGTKIPHGIWNAILALPKSVKKDKIFIKDLCLAAFGPEVLASSTICGTKKGGRKNKVKAEEGAEDTQVPEPGLDKIILKAVREKFIARVEESENCKIDLPDDHERASLKVFYGAIRDGQKRLIGLGYGQGNLTK